MPCSYFPGVLSRFEICTLRFLYDIISSEASKKIVRRKTIMTNEVFSKNLRQLRLDKNLTQEQLAGVLGVSAQSVSRWECGNTLPDVLLLPQIAKLYGVTIDDLYKEDAKAYPSYAQRLLAVYEASGRTEDFLAAEQEFERMQAAELTADDIRAWGVLYHYMVKNCTEKAKQKLEQAMQHSECPEQVFGSAAQQKIALMCDLGRGSQEAARHDRMLNENPTEAQNWVLCAAAHYMAGEQERALEVALDGIRKFPDSASLYLYAGDICRALKKYDEAFSYWKKTLDLDHTFLDAVYSMGFCYEELGRYNEAYNVWKELVRELDCRGLIIEKKWPEEMAENCLKKMK